MVAHRHSYFWVIFVFNASGMGSVSFKMVGHDNNGTNVIDWFGRVMALFLLRVVTWVGKIVGGIVRMPQQNCALNSCISFL